MVLRQRHTHCITMADIRKDVFDGRVRYNPTKHFPACSYPEDGICAAPSMSDSYVLNKIKERRDAAVDRDREGT